MAYLTYRRGLLYYALLFLVLTWPFWGGGEVIAPHRQFSELAMIDQTPTPKLENRKFSDFTSSYVPEISEHLIGPRSGWLTLWSNQNELGRPIYQISGFSPAYTLSWLLMQLTDNPWVFITTLSLLTCFFAGIFIILFCRELDLEPFAGLIAGTSLATSPLFLYWLTFPMFTAVWCWSAGALWAVTRQAKKPDILGWSTLAFSSYSLLMTAYPQLVIFHAYLLGGYGLYLAYRKITTSPYEMLCFMALALSSLMVGCVLAFPVYRDFLLTANESARIAPDTAFFTGVLPTLSNLTDVVRFLVLSTIPEIFGNPIHSNFPLPYDGLSITLLVIFFAMISLLTAFKKTWGWWLAVILYGLFTLIHPLYIFGLKFLGFNLSRSTPLCGIILPLTVILAFGVDSQIKRTNPLKLMKIVIIAVLTILLVIVSGVFYGLTCSIPIQWDAVFRMLWLTLLLASQYRKNQPRLMILSLVIILTFFSYPLILRQNPAHIAMTSPLVEKIRKNLPDGSYFAIVDPGISDFLTPNLNAGLGLSSVHSYNSLSSRRYHRLIKALGGKIHTYGRWNGSIAPDYSSIPFWMANISLLLSPNKLNHENLKYLGENSGIHLHKVISRMGDNLQVTSPQISAMPIADPRLQLQYLSSKKINKGDLLVFEVTPLPTSTLLILSQKFHPFWSAEALTKQGWVSAKTIEINGIFQGVAIPPTADTIRLKFKPFVRYAWLAHYVWLLLVIVLAGTAWKNYRSNQFSQVGN